ncbi:glycoside hydrolase family 79 protein [Dothidotthia symphoricarpi CBS 119687]|uniref:Glycoside hydrolase family 79 protein n=1 Tax=Dothidotthia symphoricarpi CBS 119687 TaxID=1392245 RepID=A0A6A6ACZ4_9PLEO|nr:glycoside hydrolase family 79 protein [Dothidotthia symphoricarpi CBS 119687]KAF2129436.1 glycoside hydrolase family 79 protein [Dothidotthia symphoricarpi CBS 119687]
MFRSLCTTSIAVLSLSRQRLALAQSISLSPSVSAPGSASDYLDPSFAGFGIEPSNLLSFTGGDVANQFSIQLLQNLADYSGAPPHIRVGGNTQDYMIYDTSYNAYNWEANVASKAQGAIAADSMVIGPSYIKAIERFPKDTPVTFGLNLAYEASDWEDKIVATAQAVVDGLTNTKLYSFEIGNEPDLWVANKFRNATWSGKAYTQEFLDRAQVVYERVLQPAGMPSSFFESAATASTIGTTFEINQLVNNGIMDGRNGTAYVNAWNQHDYYYFIGVTKTPVILDDLMDYDLTNKQFAYWEKQIAIGIKTGLPYVLREMSSVGPIGKSGISDTFGASLWTLNFYLYTASLGVSSVQMHMTDNSNASAWQPVSMYNRDPFVRPMYYANAAIAQIIGNGNGTTQISTMSTSGVGSSYSGYIRAYSAYAHDTLQAVVLINGQTANASESDKNSFTFNVNFGSDNKNKDVYLSYLTADGADSQSGTTWNGMTYSDTTGESSVVDSTVNKMTTDDSGKLSIPVRDSQAVVANLGSQLGTNVVLTPDGTQSRKNSAGQLSAGRAGIAAWTSAITAAMVGFFVLA